MHVADRAELVRVVGAAVVDDREAEVQVGTISLGPVFKMRVELRVRDDVSLVYAANIRDVVEHVLHHRLARDGQERLRLVERQRIKPRGVTSGQNDQFHRISSAPLEASQTQTSGFNFVIRSYSLAT